MVRRGGLQWRSPWITWVADSHPRTLHSQGYSPRPIEDKEAAPRVSWVNRDSGLRGPPGGVGESPPNLEMPRGCYFSFAQLPVYFRVYSIKFIISAYCSFCPRLWLTTHRTPIRARAWVRACVRALSMQYKGNPCKAQPLQLVISFLSLRAPTKPSTFLSLWATRRGVFISRRPGVQGLFHTKCVKVSHDLWR